MTDPGRGVGGTAMVKPGRPLKNLRRPAPLALQAYDQIRQMLLSPAGEPLQRLVERDLAQRLSMSRTPVREALKRLAVVGLVEPSPNGGYVPRRASIRDVNEYYDLRSLLEPFAASLAAQRAKTGEVPSLLPISEIRRRSPEANASFHRSVARASGNRILAEAIESLIERVASQRIYAEGGDAPPDALVAGHEGVAKAILRGDPVAAAAELSQHLRIAHRHALAELHGRRSTQ